MIKVISLGGSIVAPNGVDTEFLKRFREAVREYVSTTHRRLILVIGGGAPARAYQAAFREVGGDGDSNEADWIGVAATKLNAALLRAVLRDMCPNEVVSDPTGSIEFDGDLLIASGWKPGFSTDYDAVLLAERFGAEGVINLSNIERVYTADPRTDPSATPIDTISWAEFSSLVGDVWSPGSNLPFDPVATRKACELGLRVVVARGTDIENLRRILHDQTFIGTQIGPH
ncbi:MAG: UMP kinase [Spirochaetaceae bacterium]